MVKSQRGQRRLSSKDKSWPFLSRTCSRQGTGPHVTLTLVISFHLIPESLGPSLLCVFGRTEVASGLVSQGIIVVRHTQIELSILVSCSFGVWVQPAFPLAWGTQAAQGEPVTGFRGGRELLTGLSQCPMTTDTHTGAGCPSFPWIPSMRGNSVPPARGLQ